MNLLDLIVGIYPHKMIENIGVKRGVGAKHSDININAFPNNLPPECFSPTGLIDLLGLIVGIYPHKMIENIGVKRGAGAKHSDININAFPNNLPPECFSPTGLID
ncbi:MAG: hypothetical protein F6K35_31575 [Okeania sp. SIO2H7]|nr:hypothetical protein [Okeania sp. SIO2H7]